MQVTQVQVPSLSQEDPLEEEIAARSSILAWIIPCTEESGGLQSTGLERAGRRYIKWPLLPPKNIKDLMDLEAVHDVLDLYLWLRYQIFPLCASFFQVIGQIKSFS